MKGAKLLDIIYPRTCVGCGMPNPSFSAHLCWDCLSDFVMVQPPYCSRCGDPVAGYIDHEYVCNYCEEAQPGFDLARSAARYEGVLRRMLHAFKYEKAIWLARDLGCVLEACVKAHFDAAGVDAVAFVPLYPAKQRDREYNQSAVLARTLAKVLHKPLLMRCLVRVRPTESQTRLTAKQRATNVRGAFKAKWHRWLDGRRVLLVDDVMTTGATVSECARALKEGGAARVDVVTVARG